MHYETPHGHIRWSFARFSQNMSGESSSEGYLTDSDSHYHTPGDGSPSDDTSSDPDAPSRPTTSPPPPGPAAIIVDPSNEEADVQPTSLSTRFHNLLGSLGQGVLDLMAFLVSLIWAIFPHPTRLLPSFKKQKKC